MIIESVNVHLNKQNLEWVEELANKEAAVCP